MTEHPTSPDDPFRAQHKRRLEYMPWLYFSLKPKHLTWAKIWQESLQSTLSAVETVHFAGDCFLASSATLFAEPGRDIVIHQGSYIAADCYLHGPIVLGKKVSLNQGCRLEGGRAGIQIGDHTRIAAGCHFYAFNHGISLDRPLMDQPTTSRGIVIGCDVWIGAACAVTDGVTIGDHAVVGINSTVTRDVPPYAIVAGSPARIVGDRRDR